MTTYERETVAFLRAAIDGTADGEVVMDDDLCALWAAHSSVGFASWLMHDGIPVDMVRGMVAGWLARRQHERWARETDA